MQTQEIARVQWSAFLDDLSQRQRGRPVTVEVMNGEVGNEFEAKDLPLLGITADTKAAGGERIEVIAGDSPSAHAAHTIFDPARVSVAKRDDGDPVAIQIESRDGSTTLVHFERSEPLPWDAKAS